jgi:YspA, cpYpsA-related SLOG family
MKPIYKVLFFGDRNWEKSYPIKIEIRKLVQWTNRHGYELVIIEGGAEGADLLSRTLALEENVHVCHVPALWEHRHASAGPQRNEVMAALEPHEAIGFHADLTKSKGTKSMVKILDRLEIPYRIVEG